MYNFPHPARLDRRCHQTSWRFVSPPPAVPFVCAVQPLFAVVAVRPSVRPYDEMEAVTNERRRSFEALLCGGQSFSPSLSYPPLPSSLSLLFAPAVTAGKFFNHYRIDREVASQPARRPSSRHRCRRPTDRPTDRHALSGAR